MKATQHSIKINIVLTGDFSAGKSSLVNRYINNEFKANGLPTIGVDLLKKNATVDYKSIDLRIWEFSGSEKHAFTNYKLADGLIFCYDVSDRNSFENLQMWFEKLSTVTKKISSELSKLPIIKMLVGCKNDEINKCISYEEGLEFSNQVGISFLETSAKINFNVDNLFEEITKRIIDEIGIINSK